ncbi:aminotransferase class IV [Levilinea saccharolytica]|uniref:Branched-chain amino acid aminotransferase n=1 Tax=Levilinea saccharolytica TaxID=229921 RepID=A0A0P6XYL8_9CHLR|nr:aminotransferase class IV [Levilinea saccharolytica]KPL84977.1 hypothetical protein ADN01_06210 [Levilinea saccharolytica]GAP18067.1 branched-chain amino acid aminotransferase [Levilinea saccharolytica]
MNDTAVWRVNFGGDPLLLAISLPDSVIGLNQASGVLPEGAYTTFRTYQKAWVPKLDEHFRRLQETALLTLSRPVPMDEAVLRQALSLAVQRYPHGEARIRLTLDLTKHVGDVYISLEPLKTPPPEAYERGVHTLTRKMQRSNPKAKLTAFLHTAQQTVQASEQKVEEILMVDPQGFILEGLSSNFFAIQNGEIWTAEEGVLSGITRLMVFEAARNLGINIHLEPLPLRQIPQVEEAFITSASRAILPVVQVDQHVIGDGRPGEQTKALMEAFQIVLKESLEQLFV